NGAHASLCGKHRSICPWSDAVDPRQVRGSAASPCAVPAVMLVAVARSPMVLSVILAQRLHNAADIAPLARHSSPLRAAENIPVIMPLSASIPRAKRCATWRAEWARCEGHETGRERERCAESAESGSRRGSAVAATPVGAVLHYST